MKRLLNLLVLAGILVLAAGCTASEQDAQSSPKTITVVDKTVQYSGGYSHYVFTDGIKVYDTNWLTYRKLEPGKSYYFEYSRASGWLLVNPGG